MKTATTMEEAMRNIKAELSRNNVAAWDAADDRRFYRMHAVNMLQQRVDKENVTTAIARVAELTK